MATYAIGDLQGCFKTLQVLLDKIEYQREHDVLWFVGDLVNRGPASLECLRFVNSLGNRAITVLGNHDLHLLAVAAGQRKAGENDTLQPILDAPDRDSLLQWLRQQRLLHVERQFVLVHAGLLPEWDVRLAQQLANEVETQLRGDSHVSLLANMYGNQPDHWSDKLGGIERLRITINAMTRLRAIEVRKKKSAVIDLKFKGEPDKMPDSLRPWFESLHPSLTERTVIAGHWSALGLHITDNFIGLDSGCVWGRELTALRLEDRKIFQVVCAEEKIPAGWD
ncbi:MAG: symmetrical bis(5'-nucleosyl)-tetraphosphatase [Betaproteobacteria bacterium]|nr:symmetrical bis(5'-nucleosyl)-tetraphosphatase [Betaproteobacteria bacterium]